MNKFENPKLKNNPLEFTSGAGVEDMSAEKRGSRVEKKKSPKWPRRLIKASVLATAFGLLSINEARLDSRRQEALDNLEEEQGWIMQELMGVHEIITPQVEKLRSINEWFGHYADVAIGIKERHEELILRQRDLLLEEKNIGFSGRDWSPEQENGPNESIEGEESEEELVIGDFLLKEYLYDKGEGAYEWREITFPGESFRQIVIQTFPKGWTEGELSSIEQEKEEQEMDEEYGLKEDAQAVASYYDYPKDRHRLGKIVFHGASLGSSVGYIFDVVSHELAHGNDWGSDNEMSIEERVNLLFAIGERLESEDRYMSSYVEDITNKDKELERYKKATEYWAEICEVYFSNPSSLNYKDFAIIQDRVRKVDSSFNLEEAATTRRTIRDSVRDQIVGNS